MTGKTEAGGLPQSPSMDNLSSLLREPVVAGTRAQGPLMPVAFKSPQCLQRPIAARSAQCPQGCQPRLPVSPPREVAVKVTRLFAGTFTKQS
jgi:hypothetical protein